MIMIKESILTWNHRFLENQKNRLYHGRECLTI